MVNLFARTPADNFRVMPYNLRLFAMLGLWGDRRKLYRLYALLLLAYVAIIFPKPVRITDRHPFESIVRSVSELIFAALCYLTIIILAIKSEPFRAVIRKLEQALELFRDKQDQCSQLIIEVNANIHRFSLGYAKLNLLYVLLFNVIPPIYNYPRYFLQWRMPEDNRTVEFMLPLMQDLYGLDVHHNIVHYTISWVAITPFCVFCALILWFKGALFMLIRYNTLLYQLVNRLLQQYDRESAGGLLAQKHRRLQQIVQLHYRAIECTKLLDSILSLILLIQCIGCLLMLCLMLFYITRNHSLNVINIAVLLMSIFIEMLCFSYLGNQLTEENANISHSAFNCRWYDEPIVIRKYFLRIILQAHRKATITAGKFYNVNIVTFAQLIKTSYTYYMIMKEMF
ncbi:putative odorant receptor 92a isoform X2 [Anopheles gambiae]|uniref:putative odorant receptor 92a isoform X2 n=1 Tax=Anopheles gambiae TaxID=7165 RepID=UPI002AC8A518|nr:putative odorant receptor 92a isoform X2 [Anopheles gambiae]